MTMPINLTMVTPFAEPIQTGKRMVITIRREVGESWWVMEMGQLGYVFSNYFITWWPGLLISINTDPFASTYVFLIQDNARKNLKNPKSLMTHQLTSNLVTNTHIKRIHIFLAELKVATQSIKKIMVHNRHIEKDPLKSGTLLFVIQPSCISACCLFQVFFSLLSSVCSPNWLVVHPWHRSWLG